MSSRLIKIVPPILGLFVFCVFFLAMVVLHDTVTVDPPFKTYNDAALIKSYPDYTVFVYTRELTIDYDIYGSVDRVVIHSPSGKTIQLEPSGQIYRKAIRRQVYREFRLPSMLEKGEWCLFAYLKYTPGLSIKEHIYAAPKVCAYVI